MDPVFFVEHPSLHFLSYFTFERGDINIPEISAYAYKLYADD